VHGSQDKQAASIQVDIPQFVDLRLQERVEGFQRCPREILKLIEYYHYSRTTQLSDGGGHGREVSYWISQRSSVFAIGLTEAAAKCGCDIPLIGVRGLHVNELRTQVIAQAG
jgi:hypothetical protein